MELGLSCAFCGRSLGGETPSTLGYIIAGYRYLNKCTVSMCRSPSRRFSYINPDRVAFSAMFAFPLYCLGFDGY